MSKECNKYLKHENKGFTIVELVIVIAIVGILAAVLIPTFNSIIDRANESKATQEVTNAMKEYSTIDYNMNLDEIVITYSDDEEIKYIFGYENSELYIIEYSYLLDNNELYVIDNKYVIIDTLKLNNFPEHIKIYKQDLSYIKYSVKVLNEDYNKYISKSNIEALEKKYLPGEKVIINPILYAEGGIEIYINGEFKKKLMYFHNPYKYEFLMPSYDVTIEFNMINNSENPFDDSEISFGQMYPFIDNINPNEVTEIYYISNQRLYNLSTEYSRCIYITNDTEEGKIAIDEIISSLIETTYVLDETYIPEETDLPREKYVILIDDKTCEFYYEEYVTYNGKYYKNNDYKNLLGENAQEGYSFIRNDMIVTEYLTPVYYDGKESSSYIDLRRIIFSETYFDTEEVLIYDKTIHTAFRAKHGTEGDIGTFKIESSKTFSKGNSLYQIINSFSFEEYKKINKVTVISEDFTGFRVIFDYNTKVTKNDLEQYIDYNDSWFMKDSYIFTYSLDDVQDIFENGSIILDSDKVVYYIKNPLITITNFYPELESISPSDIKNIIIVQNKIPSINNPTYLPNGIQECLYIENNTRNQDMINEFIKSIKTDTYKETSYHMNSSLPNEKYIINTNEETYEFIYSYHMVYDGITYEKQSGLVNLTGIKKYTLVSNYMEMETEYPEDIFIDPYYLKTIYKNGVDTNKKLDIRNVVFDEPNLYEDNETSKYVEAEFAIYDTTYRIVDDNKIIFNDGTNLYKLNIYNDFSFKDYLDEITITLTQYMILGLYQPKIFDKVLTVNRNSVINKQDLIDEIDIINQKETEKYYIEFTNCYQEQNEETFKENTTLTVSAYFGYNLDIQDEALEFVSQNTIEKYNGIRKDNETITLPLKDVTTGYVGVKINDKLVEIISPNSNYEISFTMNEDITISFERKDSIYDFYPQEIYYKDLYPFISEIEVDDLVEIIHIDKTNTTDLFYEASFITIDENSIQSMNYAYEFLRFFKEEKCTLITEKVNTVNDGTYIIKTTKGTYEIDDYNLFMINNTRYYESKTLSPFPDIIKVDGYTFKEDIFYVTSEVSYERINPKEIVFKEMPNTDYIIVSTEVKLRCGIQEALIPYPKQLIYDNGFERVSLEIINSYSFESHLPCINMLCEYTLYNETISEETKVCTLAFKSGSTITKTKFLSLLNDYGFNEETIFAYAIASVDPTILFSDFDVEYIYESRDVVCFNTNQTIN